MSCDLCLWLMHCHVIESSSCYFHAIESMSAFVTLLSVSCVIRYFCMRIRILQFKMTQIGKEYNSRSRYFPRKHKINIRIWLRGRKSNPDHQKIFCRSDQIWIRIWAKRAKILPSICNSVVLYTVVCFCSSTILKKNPLKGRK